MEVPHVDEIIKRIQSHKGVQGVVVTTRDGTPIRSTMDNTSTIIYIGNMKHLFNLASSLIRDIEPTNQLEFMRIRTKKYELMLNTDRDFITLVIQNPFET